MSPKYLLDSVILIDHLNGVVKATKWLKKLKEGEGAISVITRAEVLTGISDEHIRSTVKVFLDQYDCLPVKLSDSDLAADLRRDQKWRLPDAFQVALAKSHNLTFVTRNTKDFDQKKNSFVQIPYVLEI